MFDGFGGVLSVMFSYVNLSLITSVNVMTVQNEEKILILVNYLKSNLNLFKQSLVFFSTTECCVNEMKYPDCKLLLKCIQMVIF